MDETTIYDHIISNNLDDILTKVIDDINDINSSNIIGTLDKIDVNKRYIDDSIVYGDDYSSSVFINTIENALIDTLSNIGVTFTDDVSTLYMYSVLSNIAELLEMNDDIIAEYPGVTDDDDDITREEVLIDFICNTYDVSQRDMYMYLRIESRILHRHLSNHVFDVVSDVVDNTDDSMRLLVTVNRRIETHPTLMGTYVYKMCSTGVNDINIITANVLDMIDTKKMATNIIVLIIYIEKQTPVTFTQQLNAFQTHFSNEFDDNVQRDLVYKEYMKQIQELKR